jgi:hypothetical protein
MVNKEVQKITILITTGVQMKKIMLAVCTTLFLMSHAAGMDNKATEKSKIKFIAKKSSPTSSDAHDYETFKAAEEAGAILDEAIVVIAQENPDSSTSKVSHEYDATRCQTSTGIVILPHSHISDVLCTPWGTKTIIGIEDASEKYQELSARIIELIGTKLILVAEKSVGLPGGLPHRVVKVNGKYLPPLAMRDASNELDDTVVEGLLKQHQERYQKEITDEVVPFVPVRAVAEMVTAYLIKKDD